MFSVQVCIQINARRKKKSAAGVARSENRKTSAVGGARVVILIYYRFYSLILGQTSAAGRGGLSFKSRWRERQRRVDNVHK